MTDQLALDRQNLSAMFHQYVTGFAHPFGVYNNLSVQMLGNLDFSYARTINATHTFFTPNNLLTWHPTAHHNDPLFFDLINTFLSADCNGLFTIFGHSYEFDVQDNWAHLLQICRRLSGRDDILYTTNVEISAYAQALNNLTVRNNTIINQTDTPI